MTLTTAIAFTLSLLAAGAQKGDGKSNPVHDAIKNKQPAEQLELLGKMKRTADVLYYTGNAFFSLANLDSAVVYYTRAVDMDPTYVKAIVNKGIAQEELKQTVAARNTFQQALAVNPDDVLALCHLGNNLVVSGRVEEGVAHYMHALKVDPDSPQAHYNLGLAFAELRVFGEALTEWKRVVELDPDGDLGRLASENVELIEAYMNL